MSWLFPWFLFAHVLGAIAAFGPSYSMPIIGRMGGAEPQHANFATRVGWRSRSSESSPLALLQGVTGVGLIVTGSVDLTRAGWLMAAIVLYVIALGFSYLVQAPTDPEDHRDDLDAATAAGAGRGALRPAAGAPGPHPALAARRHVPCRPDRGHRLPDGGEAVLTPGRR